jgi:uncharacterized membrane protein
MSIIDKYSNLLATKKPYGIYNAIDWDGQKLIDNVNNHNAMPIRGSTINQMSSTDGGAGVSIPYIYGNNSSGLAWPPGSIGTNLTICGIMRYTGNTQNILLHDVTDMLHVLNDKGSLDIKCGKNICHKNGFFNNHANGWMTTCFKTSANDDSPNNVVVNGSAIGTASSGGPLLAVPPNGQSMSGYNGPSRNFLVINGNQRLSLNSDFALAYLVIWDQELTSNELMIVNNALQNYLSTGKIGFLPFGNPSMAYNEGEVAGTNDYDPNNVMLDSSILPDVIQHQEYIKQAIADENDRINQKKQSVDYAVSGQKRDIQLNQSYRKKYMVYTNILICVVVALIIYIVFSSINLAYGSFSAFAMNSLAFALLSFCIFYIIFALYTIQTRDPLNFDELVLPAPIIGSNVVVADASMNIIANYGNCANSDCCNVGTTWNSDLAKCEPTGYSFNTMVM